MPATLEECGPTSRFSEPRLSYRSLQHVLTRGHACGPSILFLREAVAPVRSAVSYEHFRTRPRARRAMPSDSLPRTSLRRPRRALRSGSRARSRTICWREDGARHVPHCCSAWRAAWAENPRVKDARAGIGFPMRGVTCVPLLVRLSSTLCHRSLRARDDWNRSLALRGPAETPIPSTPREGWRSPENQGACVAS